MKDKKTTFKFFTISEWKAEENYLRQQHKNGWKFVRVDHINLYHFERCQPEDVVYQLDYNAKGLAEKENYVQMFQDCGWEYLQDYVGYSYFRKPVSQMNGREEIFSDDESRLDMIKRVFEGRMMPLLIIFFLLIIPQIYQQIRSNFSEGYILLILYAILFFIYLSVFLRLGYFYIRCRREIKNHRQ